jgi:hypothetical protein
LQEGDTRFPQKDSLKAGPKKVPSKTRSGQGFLLNLGGTERAKEFPIARVGKELGELS